MKDYVIRGGSEGKERLRLLSRVMRPTTVRLLDEAGVTSGMACLDVGCGGGDVTLELARRADPGEVVGIDADASILALARADAQAAGAGNVRYVEADATRWRPDRAFDLVYARFLLTHVRGPEAVLGGMAAAARTGGVVAVEDIDFAGHFCHPPCAAFERYVGLYREAVRRRGGDAEIGPKLPSWFLAAGLQDVRVSVAQPAALRGETKEVAAITLDKISDAVIAEGLASEGELMRVIRDLEAYAADPRTLMSLPRVFQVWGRRV